jgi:hypothetical protein
MIAEEATMMKKAIWFVIAPLLLTPAQASNIEIAASITEDTPACQSSSDYMQMINHLRSNNLQAIVNDMTIYYGSGKCIDLKRGDQIYIESEPMGDLLCVRPTDKSVCFWAYTSNVLPDK